MAVQKPRGGLQTSKHSEPSLETPQVKFLASAGDALVKQARVLFSKHLKGEERVPGGKWCADRYLDFKSLLNKWLFSCISCLFKDWQLYRDTKNCLLVSAE